MNSLIKLFFSSTDTVSRSTPWYIYAAISAAAIFVVVAALTVVICILKGRRKKQKRDKEQAASPAGNTSKQDLSFCNLAYSSTNDLKPEGLRSEVWPMGEL